LMGSSSWLLLLSGSWAALAGWALLYAVLLHRKVGVSPERALFWAACCHLPLLLCIAVVAAVQGSEGATLVYAFSPLGQKLFQPLAKDYVVAAPLVLQALVLAGHRARSIARAWPAIAIMAVSLGLRASHLAWGLPALLHPDEHRYIGPATIIVARGDLNPHYFENPSVMIYLASLLFWLLTEQSILFHTMDEFLNLGIPDPRGDFLQMVALRGVVALAGTMTVLAAYLSGKELFGRRAGLFGACLLAVSFLHVRNSHYATNDMLATCFLAGSFLFSTRIYTRGRTTDYLLAGILGGLGTSTKYNVGFFAVAILVAHLLRGRTMAHLWESRTSTRHLRSHLPMALAGFTSLAAFVAGTPYSALDFPSFLADFRSQFGYGGSLWHGQEAGSPAIAFLLALIQGYGLVPLALSLVGIAVGLRRSPRAIGLVASLPLCYFLFMANTQLFFARFALPLLPFLAVLGGFALARLVETVRKPVHRGAFATLLLTLAVAQPLVLTLRHDLILGRPDTRLLATAWIDANLPEDSSLAMESYAQLDAKFWWKGHRVRDTWVYWPEREGWLASALEGGYRYLVVTSYGYGPWQPQDSPPQLLPPSYHLLEEKGHLVAAFAAGQGNRELPFRLDDMYTPFWDLFERERSGPTVRIYRLGGER